PVRWAAHPQLAALLAATIVSASPAQTSPRLQGMRRTPHPHRSDYVGRYVFIPSVPPRFLSRLAWPGLVPRFIRPSLPSQLTRPNLPLQLTRPKISPQLTAPKLPCGSLVSEAPIATQPRHQAAPATGTPSHRPGCYRDTFTTRRSGNRSD